MLLLLLQALTLADKNGIPRDTFLAFVDAFYPCRPIQVGPRPHTRGRTLRCSTRVSKRCLLPSDGVPPCCWCVMECFSRPMVQLGWESGPHGTQRVTGLDTGHSHEFCLLIPLSCPHTQGYARRAAEEQLDPGQGFTVDLAIKDVR